MQTENNRKMCKHIKDKDLLPFVRPLPLPRKGAKTMPRLESSEFREIKGIKGIKGKEKRRAFDSPLKLFQKS